jgi:hypothetical protein
MQEMVRKGSQTGKLNTMYTYEGDAGSNSLKTSKPLQKILHDNGEDKGSDNTLINCQSA